MKSMKKMLHHGHDDHGESYFKQGLSYLEGFRFRYSEAKALEQFKQAAKLGNWKAQFYLIMYYEENTLDLDEIYHWHWVEKLPPKPRKSEDEKEIQRYVKHVRKKLVHLYPSMGADGNHIFALALFFNIGGMRELAKEIIDLKKDKLDEWRVVVKYKNNTTVSQFLYGYALLAGTCGMHLSKKEAFTEFYEVAMRGLPCALYRVGMCFLEGVGVKKVSEKEAMLWFKKAMKVGYDKAAKKYKEAEAQLERRCSKLIEKAEQAFNDAKMLRDERESHEKERQYYLEANYLEMAIKSYEQFRSLSSTFPYEGPLAKCREQLDISNKKHAKENKANKAKEHGEKALELGKMQSVIHHFETALPIYAELAEDDVYYESDRAYCQETIDKTKSQLQAKAREESDRADQHYLDAQRLQKERQYYQAITRLNLAIKLYEAGTKEKALKGKRVENDEKLRSCHTLLEKLELTQQQVKEASAAVAQGKRDAEDKYFNKSVAQFEKAISLYNELLADDSYYASDRDRCKEALNQIMERKQAYCDELLSRARIIFQSARERGKKQLYEDCIKGVNKSIRLYLSLLELSPGSKMELGELAACRAFLREVQDRKSQSEKAERSMALGVAALGDSNFSEAIRQYKQALVYFKELSEVNVRYKHDQSKCEEQLQEIKVKQANYYNDLSLRSHELYTMGQKAIREREYDNAVKVLKEAVSLYKELIDFSSTPENKALLSKCQEEICEARERQRLLREANTALEQAEKFVSEASSAKEPSLNLETGYSGMGMSLGGWGMDSFSFCVSSAKSQFEVAKTRMTELAAKDSYFDPKVKAIEERIIKFNKEVERRREEQLAEQKAEAQRRKEELARREEEVRISKVKRSKQGDREAVIAKLMDEGDLLSSYDVEKLKKEIAKLHEYIMEKEPRLGSYRALGENHLKLGEYSEAVKYFTQGIESVGTKWLDRLDSSSLYNAHIGRAIAHKALQRYEEAIGDCTMVINNSYGSREKKNSLRLRGQCYYLLGDYYKALIDYHRLFDSDSGTPSHERYIYDKKVYCLVGLAYVGKGEYSEAVKYFDKAIKENVEFAKVLHKDALYLCEQTDEYKQESKELAALEASAARGDRDAQLRLAQRLEQSEIRSSTAKVKALEWYRIAADSGEPVAQKKMAQDLEAKGDMQEACYWYARAADEGENDSELYLQKLGLKKKTAAYVRAAKTRVSRERRDAKEAEREARQEAMRKARREEAEARAAEKKAALRERQEAAAHKLVESGQALIAKGQNKQGVLNLRKAIQRYEKLSEPNGGYEKEIAMCEEQIEEVKRASQARRAQKASVGSERAKQSRETAVRREPEPASHHRLSRMEEQLVQAAADQYELGLAQSSRGKNKDAVRAYHSAIKTYQLLAEKDSRFEAEIDKCRTRIEELKEQTRLRRAQAASKRGGGLASRGGMFANKSGRGASARGGASSGRGRSTMHDNDESSLGF